jgi:hypothetical protein
MIAIMAFAMAGLMMAVSGIGYGVHRALHDSGDDPGKGA